MNQIEPVSVGIKPLQATSLGALAGSFLESMMDTKICRRCGEEKSIEEYYKRSNMADGYLNICKTCNKRRRQKYYSEHKDEINIQRRKAPHSNREKMNAYNRKYYHKYHEERLAYAKLYRQNNPLQSRATSAVKYAIKKGYLIRPGRCSECNTECKPHAHHEDYTKPLEVTWLCTICHRNLHLEKRVI